MVKPVTLPNGLTWRKQGDAMNYFKEMLSRHQIGHKITGSDHSDLVALVDVYDRDLGVGEPTKAGPGILHFTKENVRDAGFTTACFHVHRTDGTVIDFSYQHAVRSAAKFTN